MGTEIELKLLVAGKDLPRLREALKQYAAGSRPQRRRLVSRYFDTAMLRFHDSGVALRVRRVDGRWVQTLKGEGDVDAGIHRRSEWEMPVSRSRPDLAGLAAAFSGDRALKRLLKKLPDEEALVQVFSTDFRRDALMLTLPDGSRVEAAIDEGEVAAGKRRKPISELELELKSGSPAAAFAFARKVLAEVPLTIGVVSKAERGYGLVLPGPLPAPRKAAAVEITASMPVDEAFARILAECLGHLLANVDGVIEGRDPEYLHQVRVAMRRLRGALAVFGDVVPKVAFAALAAEFRKLGQVLGETRNWDVLLHETLPAYSKATNVAIDTQLASELEQRAAKAKAVARRLARSRAFTDQLLKCGAFVVGRAWREAATEATAAALAEPAGVFALRAVARRHRQLKKRVAVIEPGRPETLHAVRIAAKKLRYSVEFFSSLYPAKGAQRYLKGLVEVQDILGRVNDAATASRHLSMVAAEAPAVEAGGIESWLRQRSTADQARFAATWRRFAKLAVVPK